MQQEIVTEKWRHVEANLAKKAERGKVTPWLNSVPAGCNRGEFNHVDFAISEVHLEDTLESGI